ncbi:MAG: DUF1501 domain-containing protein [bacterium]
MGPTNQPRVTRRGFLRGALIAGGGLATLGGGYDALTRLAHAQGDNPDAPERYYIFAYFPGAWDVLLGLDPRDPRQFTNGNLRTTRIQPGYELVEMADADLVRVSTAAGDELSFGPYIGDLARHADRLCVVRGMSMDTLTHEVGRRRFITGKPPSGLQARGTSAGTWLADRFGGKEPIPQLSVQVEAYNVERPDFATALKVNSVNDLLRALRPAAPEVDWRVGRQMSETLAEQARCLRATPSPLWRSAEGSRQKAREMVTGGFADAFDFSALNPLMNALRAHYGITNRNDLNTPEARAALAVQAITTGISRVVSVAVTPSLDTHFDDWITDQGPNQRRGFNAIARMAEMLAQLPYGNRGESWLDHTTIVGFSEFSRTPLLNTRGGRDHHLTNSCFLLGGGVRGGQVIGASSDVGMSPQTVNLHTGAVDPDGEVIRPEHIIQTLYDEVGIDFAATDLRVPECRMDLLDPCSDRTSAIPALIG